MVAHWFSEGKKYAIGCISRKCSTFNCPILLRLAYMKLSYKKIAAQKILWSNKLLKNVRTFVASDYILNVIRCKKIRAAYLNLFYPFRKHENRFALWLSLKIIGFVPMYKHLSSVRLSVPECSGQNETHVIQGFNVKKLIAHFYQL